jgi:hypothetical protein
VPARSAGCSGTLQAALPVGDLRWCRRSWRGRLWPSVQRLVGAETCVTWADTLQIVVGSAPRSGVGRAGLGLSGGG